ncbi:MAG: thermonuclease family protein [Burkholderiales bacterium]
MRWNFLWLVVVLSSAQAEEMHGTVVGISGGDAITVADDHGKEHRVILLGIEAPALSTPLGSRSYQRLADLLYNVPVSVDVRGRDNFQRLLGKVTLNGRDVALHQIESGVAVHAISELQTAEEREAYTRAQTKAQAAKLGLWGEQPTILAEPELRENVPFQCKEIRNTLRCDDGTVFTQIGTRVYGSDGSVYRKRGDTVFSSNGSTFRQRGNVTYGSDGSICRQRGRVVNCY